MPNFTFDGAMNNHPHDSQLGQQQVFLIHFEELGDVERLRAVFGLEAGELGAFVEEASNDN